MKDLSLEEFELEYWPKPYLPLGSRQGVKLHGEMASVCGGRGQPGAERTGPAGPAPSSSCQMVIFGRWVKDTGKA